MERRETSGLPKKKEKKKKKKEKKKSTVGVNYDSEPF